MIGPVVSRVYFVGELGHKRLAGLREGAPYQIKVQARKRAPGMLGAVSNVRLPP